MKRTTGRPAYPPARSAPPPDIPTGGQPDNPAARPPITYLLTYLLAMETLTYLLMETRRRGPVRFSSP